MPSAELGGLLIGPADGAPSARDDSIATPAAAERGLALNVPG